MNERIKPLDQDQKSMEKGAMMKQVIFGVAAIALTGCASLAVDDNSLQQRTAFALGMDADTFTISNRQDDGVRTQYSVTTKAGQKYNCYVTGTFSIVGRTVSDAVCNKPGQQARNPLTGQ